MQSELTVWLEDRLMPVLLSWPDDQRLRLAAGLIGAVLISGLLARWVRSSALPSAQGRIAVAVMLFLASLVSLLRGFLALDWGPVLEGLVAVLVLGIPAYFLGALTETVEDSVKEAAADQVRRRGMRDQVLEELREQKIDRMVYAEALERVDGDKDRVRAAYIGLRSRKLARVEEPGAAPDPDDPKYGRIEFDPIGLPDAKVKIRNGRR